MRRTADSHPGTAGRPPRTLAAAAVLVVLQAVVLVGQGVLEGVSLSTDRAAMGVTTSAFFLLYGAGLAYCGLGLARRVSWVRAPVIVTELIALLVAWSFLGGETTWVAVAIALFVVPTLALLFHPATSRALAEPSPEPDPDGPPGPG